MKYMWMMHAPPGNGDWAAADWPPQNLEAHIDFMMRFNRELTETGELAAQKAARLAAEHR